MEQQKKQKLVITSKDGKPMPIPPEGALGLLALGYKGLIAWRNSRNAYIQMMKKQAADKKDPSSKEPENINPEAKEDTTL